MSLKNACRNSLSPWVRLWVIGRSGCIFYGGIGRTDSVSHPCALSRSRSFWRVGAVGEPGEAACPLCYLHDADCQWSVSQVAAILLLQDVFGLTEWKLRWKWIGKKLDVNWGLKTPLSNYLAVQRGKAVRNHVQKWVGQDEKHDRVMDAQRMKLMAKKLKLKYMMKWMKRKSDPTWGFVKILATKKIGN